jgi:hypothetical protein
MKPVWEIAYASGGWSGRVESGRRKRMVYVCCTFGASAGAWYGDWLEDNGGIVYRVGNMLRRCGSLIVRRRFP